MNTTTLVAKTLIAGGLIAHALLGQEGSDHRAADHQMATMDHHHAAAVPVTYEEITRTGSLLDILLYEKSQTGPGGYALVGVSYLLKAEPDADGQPKNPPFPKSLASWHRHANLCVFPDRSVKANLNESECTAQGGQFSALTEWMVHAWIWKDSPAGVFSPTNPNVQ